MKTISRNDLKTKISNGESIYLLEALPEKYFLEGHLPGARLLPHDKVNELAPKVVPNKKAPVVVYCASATCQNSHQAAEALESMGYADVKVYLEGKADWVQAGLPIEH